MTWSYSVDEERYDGDFETKQAAIDEAMKEVCENEQFWIGENVPPIQPEDWWEAYDWLEFVSCQDDYCCELGDDWDQSTKEQREELETAVRKVMADWLDRHKLRPTFFTVQDVEEYRKVDGAAVCVGSH